MTYADFCPITPGIAPWRAVSAWLFAALFARREWQPFPYAQACFTSFLTGRFSHPAPYGQVGQISPDKDVNCRYTTAAFTLSPEPGASSCCADLPGDWALYAISVRRLIALRSGFLRTVPHGSALAFG
jgi:hypothetical protein